MLPMFEFNITSSDTNSSARTGVFATPHGEIHTPCFMPCGTKGSVKTLTPDELKTLGCEIILGNTFHLMLRPGGDTVAKMGGLHKWISWDRPMLTDSGGFQVFSLAKLRKIDDDGVTFQSPIDGSTHILTPERSIEIQQQLGADIIMAFDECAPGDADFDTVKKAMERTHNWLIRSQKAKTRDDQTLFPIVQGGIYKDLRKESAEFCAAQNSAGVAIGGVAVGEPKPYMLEVIETVIPLLTKEKPRYLMGIGEPTDILDGVMRGVDMFDCVIPTRLARHGSFWTEFGRRDITKSEFAQSDKSLMEGCKCYSCQNFTISYMRHLMIEKEILGHRLITIHNLHFLLELMRNIRQNITRGTLTEYSKNFTCKFNAKAQ